MQTDETTRDDSRIDSKGIDTNKDSGSQSPLQATFRGGAVERQTTLSDLSDLSDLEADDDR